MSSLGWKLIRNFEKDFIVDSEQVRIKFVTMSCVHKQLYQVYVPFQGRTVRFHIQKDTEGQFKIVGKGVCPPPYVPLEEEFAAAIEASPIG
ncbi:hypothetical protein EGT74_24130 [Chitinophaga lutea]|uniref:Uncharacterized protein n=1 Tax=Chitinophaga lutea TaxID=2488634 RepID=A0A3N4PB54_9BACT|nr:hypothetical protein [Chitinophaga lutea]RPE05476.1 hypothetical protein EGT74_24130 [Chitinophaga lutea]